MNFIDIGRSMILYNARIHTHDLWEIVLNLKGEGSTLINGKAVSFEAGTVICLPPKTPHEKHSKDGFQDIFIHSRFLNIPCQTEETVLSDDDGTITSLFSIIYDINLRSVRSHREISEQLFGAIEQIIIGKLEMTAADPRIEQIKNAISNNFNDPDFSVTPLIKNSGYCDDHLRRLFRRETGMSMLEYLTDIRISYAKKLLSENHRLHYSIAEIGAMCGFYDISYFSRVFKKITGIAPSEFK